MVTNESCHTSQEYSKIKNFVVNRNITMELIQRITTVAAAFLFSTSPLAEDEIAQAVETGKALSEQQLLNMADDATTNYLSDFFPTVEVNYSIADGDKPLTGILFVAPIFESEDLTNTFFNQSSIFHQDGDTTVNLGLGFRRLAFNQLALLGANMFYDHELDTDHKRTSFGGEFRTSIAELNANYYWALSDLKTINATLFEQALDGWDLELGVPLPFINWAKVYAKTFRWHGESNDDFDGNEYSLRLNPPFSANWTVEAIVSDREEGDDVKTLTVTYNFLTGVRDQSKSQNLIQDTAYQLHSMAAHRFDKVRRENRIIKEETTAGFAIVGF